MENNEITLNCTNVGTYEIVDKPPRAKGNKNVDKRFWKNKRIEIVDFGTDDEKYIDYYTKYKDVWVKMSIRTDLEKTALHITKRIYNAMESNEEN